MEDYKKKYEAAIKQAKAELKTCGSLDCDAARQIFSFFPELKESENERIRKEIIQFLQLPHPQFVGKRNHEEWISWLEKQGEQKQIRPIWKYKKDHTPLLRDSFILNKYGCVGKSPSGALVSDVWVLDFDELAKLPKEEFERQSEQKPLDKVEPKFKVGDVIKNIDNGDTVKIEQILDNYYCYSGWDGAATIHSDFTISEQDNWELVEKKPTDKLEPKFKVGDIMRTHQEVTDGFTDGMPVVVSIDEKYYHCTNELIAIKNQDDYEYPPMNRRQKSAWSKEDENIVNDIIEVLDEEYVIDYQKIVNWLKSLKERYTWKPSDEQMATFWDAICNLNQDGYKWVNDMKSLYQDLTKLRKE